MPMISEAEHDLISLSELCNMLSISAATGRNWVKSGKLTPQHREKKKVYFSRAYALQVKDDVQNGKNTALKSRRNKKYVTGSSLYNSYISANAPALKSVREVLTYIEELQLSIGETELCAILAECALQLLLSQAASSCIKSTDGTTSSSGSRLEIYLAQNVSLNGYEFLIDDLFDGSAKASILTFIGNNRPLFEIEYPNSGHDDLLGLLYISVRNLGQRKATGSYYTPNDVVQTLCSKLFATERFSGQTQSFEKNHALAGKKLLDPSCGTGNFLLQLPDTVRPEQIFANDMDTFSVKLARINLALRYGIKDREFLYSHVTNEDYLNHHFPGKFDYIFGNPPWGYAFSEDEKKALKETYLTAQGTAVESYDLFIEQALRDLAPGGTLSFVLPEAILNVRTHAPVRKLLLQTCSFRYLNYLGNAFDKVQCPSIIFQVQQTQQVSQTGEPTSHIGMEVCDASRSFVISKPRQLDAECFSFLSDDTEYALLRKIAEPAGKAFLRDKADFALGIVTGNNSEYISHIKTEENECILKGSDLCRYRFRETTNYVVFEPERFQQTAPVRFYRAPEKLLYRFVSNQLVFAYDDRQTLSLNSCNIVIPQIEDLSIRYILAVLNSRILQYYYQKTFHSVKVLRSHIEQLPIPRITKKQQEELLTFVDILLAVQEKEIIIKTYNELDRKIASLFGLTEEEYLLILHSMDEEHLSKLFVQ